VHAALGRDDRASAIFAKVADAAPGMLADARRELEARGGATDPCALLEQALVMLQGNRSSSTTFYRSGGAVRGVPNRAGSARRLHERDADILRAGLTRLRSARRTEPAAR
jgi:hypothetical protein